MAGAFDASQQTSRVRMCAKRNAERCLTRPRLDFYSQNRGNNSPET